MTISKIRTKTSLGAVILPTTEANLVKAFEGRTASTPSRGNCLCKVLKVRYVLRIARRPPF